ncbi:hypothetical protein ACMHYJ_10120 [Castellaniella hirudinis]|uniref:hypothetical protein n=1 Tax=Castellaniella hirudinis TaxID=1144617 RepID=UPI0039C0460D
MFDRLFKKKLPPVDTHQKVQDFLTLAAADPGNLLKPRYVGWLRDEAHAAACRDQLPMLYVWNEDAGAGTFSYTVNGTVVGFLLEALLPREHPQFVEVRDELMRVLKDVTMDAMVYTCKEVGLMPSQVLPNID